MKRSSRIVLGIVTVILVVICILSVSWWQIQSRPSGVFATEPFWIFTTPEWIITTPLVDGDVVYIRTTESVFALRTSDGRVLWETGSPGEVLDTPPPMIAGNILVVPESEEGVIAAFAADSGEFLWRVGPDYDARVQTMAYSEGILAVARYSEYVTAYDLENGEVEWRQPLPNRDFSQVVADHDVLYVGELTDLSAYQISSGDLLWRICTCESVGRMMLADNLLFMALGSADQTEIVAYDINLRTFIWRLPFPSSQPSSYTHFALDGAILYVAADSLMAVDTETGNLLWETEPLGDIERPVILNNTVYIVQGSPVSDLLGLDTLSGTQTSFLPLGLRLNRASSAELNPAVAGDLLIVRVNSNSMYAYLP